MATLEDCLKMLESKRKLDRENGIKLLKSLYDESKMTQEQKHKLTGILRDWMCSRDTDYWERTHGAIMAVVVLVENSEKDDSFIVYAKSLVPNLLENTESRIRIETGLLIGQLCSCHGAGEYSDMKEYILSGIRDNIDRDVSSANEELMHKLSSRHDSTGDEESEIERPSSPSAAQIFHDTAGWKSLETYMNALRHAVEGCGHSFESHITTELLDLLFTALKHTNRFVREMGYKVIASIVQCPGLSQTTIHHYWILVAHQLVDGLADNWSQVRMAASIATRQFLTHLTTSEAKQLYLPLLLPAMCLNRYYIAEGVRLYSQDTWRHVTEGRGIQLVEQYIQQVVTFYTKESVASNHAVREAACTCIAELGSKVSSDCLRPHVPQLTSTLLDCFKDDSWPVRDAACLACGQFIMCYPDECKPFIDELYPLFIGNLEDSIPSVRQGAAVAIANVVKAYGPDMQSRVLTHITDNIPLVAQQPPNTDQTSPRAPGIDPSPAIFGVVKRITDQDIEAHSNQQMYSCGSLAPKMKRGGGCMDHQFHKPTQPWEKSEGCVHLLSELSQLKECHSSVATILPLLADSTRHKQYTQHYNYLDTVLKQLPVIAKSIGKRPFKQHLEGFLDAMFYGITSDSPQLQVTSTECVQQLSNFIGSTIFRGRVEQYNPSYLQKVGDVHVTHSMKI